MIHISSTDDVPHPPPSFTHSALPLPEANSSAMAAADDDSSDLSSLPSLSPIPSDDELDDLSDDAPTGSKSGILKFFPKLSDKPPKEPSPPPRKRSPSPPHEYVLADNPDIAVRNDLLQTLFPIPQCTLALPGNGSRSKLSGDAKFRVQTSSDSTNSRSFW